MGIIEVNYEFNHKQSEFWRTLLNDTGTALGDNPYTEIAYWGGWGAGKTSSILLGINQLCEIYPRCLCVVIRDTWDQLDDTVITDFHNIFQKAPYKYMEQKKVAKYSNGSSIRFRAFDKPENILGGNIDIIVVSQAEQIPHELFSQLFGRMRGPGRIPKKIIITEGNPSEGWAKDRYKNPDKPLPPRCKLIETSAYDNEKVLRKLNPHYFEDIINSSTPGQIRRNLYGEWGDFDEMVLANFSERLNVLDPFDIPASYRKAVGGDYGFRNPAAFAWLCVDYDGNVIVYDEYKEPGKMVAELAMASFRHGRLPVAYDFSAKRPDRDGKSVWSELESHGVNLVEANKDERRNISVTNGMFKQGRLFVTRNCVELIKEIRAYKWKKHSLKSENQPKEEPVDKNNHLIDSLLYGVAYIEDLKSRPPEEIDRRKTLAFHTQQREDKKLINYG